MNTCAIAYASDDNGVTLLGISLYSLLRAKNPDTHYKIYILENSISPENQQKILSLQSQFPCEISFIPIHQAIKTHFANFHTQWPATTFGRMFIPSLIPHEDLMLYIDIDTLILRDLSDIQNINLTHHLAAAVNEAINQESPKIKSRLSIPQSSGYFNAGVLYMNLKLMREQQYEQEFLTFFREKINILNCPDQDILNATLHHRCVHLAPSWNWPTSQTRKLLFMDQTSNHGWGNQGYPAMIQAAKNPHIIHFPGKPKPTHHNYKFHRKIYREIWLQSPWKHIPIQGSQKLKHALKRLLYAPIDFLTKRKINQFPKS